MMNEIISEGPDYYVSYNPYVAETALAYMAECYILVGDHHSELKKLDTLDSIASYFLKNREMAHSIWSGSFSELEEMGFTE